MQSKEDYSYRVRSHSSRFVSGDNLNSSSNPIQNENDIVCFE